MLQTHPELKAAAAAGLLCAGMLMIPIIRISQAKRAARAVSDPYLSAGSEPEIRAALENAVPGNGENASALPNFPAGAYLLRLKDNTLSVYREGSREPAVEYELPAGWLPDYDRILLEYGIRVQNETELRGLLEDYIS